MQGRTALDDATTFPRLPVGLELSLSEHATRARVRLGPKQLDAIPKPGLAGFPPRALSDNVARLVQEAKDEKSLAVAWDAVLRGIEHDLPDRHDAVVPAQTRAHQARAGPDDLA